MTKKIHNTPWGSLYTGSLSRGCQQCITGSKLVVLVTTECTSNCFYCPLSIERKTSHYAFANERPIRTIDDLIIEASNMDAKGASMTGGDPLEEHSFSKTLEFSGILRKNYSESFHIHLYTRGKEITSEMLSAINPYIDEIRFHVINLEKDFNQIKLATQFEMDIGIEVPLIPTKGFEYYCEMITRFSTIIPDNDQFFFINLNELEVSETNYRKLLTHGLKCNPHNLSAVDGSYELGQEIIEWASHNSTIPVHLCALQTKDAVQLPNRLHRIANTVKLPSDVVIPDGPDKGLLIRGVIQSKYNDLTHIRRVLLSKFQIPENLISVDLGIKRLLTNAALLDELKEDIKTLFPTVTLGIAEEYPTYDRLQTTWIEL